MITPENISILIQISTLVGILFGVYFYFRKPQERNEINDVLFGQELKFLKDMVINLRDNHIHSIEIKLDKHIDDNQNYFHNDIKWKSRIEAIMEERLPCHKK